MGLGAPRARDDHELRTPWVRSLADLGIHCIDQLGFMGFAVFVVFHVHVDRLGLSAPPRVDRQLALPRSPSSPLSSSRAFPFPPASPHPPPADHLRPHLPPLFFTADELLPDTDSFPDSHDVPLHFYRRQRVLRAVGAIPGDRILPPPLVKPATPMVSTDLRRGQFIGDVAVTA